MAIDHTSLGVYELFPIEYNWDRPPSIKLNPERQIIGYPGTSQDLLPVLTKVPTMINANVLLYDKEIEKTLLDFFVARKGRLGKFWLKHPLSNYTLYETAVSTSTILKITSTGFDDFWTGVERIFLKSTNGNSCIKKITDVELVEIPVPHLVLTLDSAIVDDWNAGDTQVNMGQVLLVRFNKDDLNITYETDRVAQVSLQMIELLYEYSEV